MRRIIKIILVALIFINFVYVISGIIHFPLRSVDVYAIWMFKAKAFYVYQEFPLEFLRTVGYSHPQYPIMLPWIFYQIFELFGEFREIYVLALYPFIYLVILYLAYKFFLKLNLSKIQSLFFTYTYSMMSPLLAQAGRNHAGTADIIITFIYWMLLFVLYEIVKQERKDKMWIAALLIAIASQIKQEGVFAIALFAFLPIDTKRKIFWGVIAVIPTIVWNYMRIKLEISADFGLIIPSFSLIIERLIIVITEIFKEMLNVGNWYVFWIVFWVVLILQKSKDKIFTKTIQPTLLLMTSMYIIIYLFSQIEVVKYVSSSADRIMLQLSPFLFSIFVHRTKLISDKILK